MTNNSTASHHDPDKKREKNEGNGELVCKYCNAIYQGKHWQSLEKLDLTLIDKFKKGVCPACHMSKNHLSDGVLHLSGAGFMEKKEEIKNLVENIGKKEEERDIENRVERIEEKSDSMIVYTSKNQLAVEIGKKIADSHKGGTLDIKWSKEDKPVDVTWNKD